MLDKLYTGEKEFLGFQEHFGMKNRSIMDLVRFDPPEMEYTMSNIPIAYIKNSDRIYKLDMTKSKRILIIGASGCLPHIEKIFAKKEGKKFYRVSIKQAFKSGCNTFLSYDFKNSRCVKSSGRIIHSGEKEIYKITLEDGSIINASQDHKFFIDKDIEKKVCDLHIGDSILKVLKHNYDGKLCDCGKTHKDFTGLNNPVCREEVKKKISVGNRKYPILKKICDYCKKEYILGGRLANPRKFCSRECYILSDLHRENSVKNFYKATLVSNANRKKNKGLYTLFEIMGEERAKQRIAQLKENTQFKNSKFQGEMSKRRWSNKEKKERYIEKYLRGENNPMYGRTPNYPKPFIVEGLNHFVRSTWEREVFLKLKKNNIIYKYELEHFKVVVGSLKKTYTPDALINNHIILEVKGAIYDWQVDKMKAFKEQYPQYKFVSIICNRKNDFDKMSFSDKIIFYDKFIKDDFFIGKLFEGIET